MECGCNVDDRFRDAGNFWPCTVLGTLAEEMFEQEPSFEALRHAFFMSGGDW